MRGRVARKGTSGKEMRSRTPKRVLGRARGAFSWVMLFGSEQDLLEIVQRPRSPRTERGGEE